MSDKPAIPYPAAPRQALDINPRLLCIYGQHKVGKTESVTKLAGCLTIVLKGGAADHLSGNIMDLPRLCESGAFGPPYSATSVEAQRLPAGLSKEEQTTLLRSRFICDCYLRTLEDLYTKTAAGTPVAPYVAHDGTSDIEEWVFDLALRGFRTTMQGQSSKHADLRRVTDLPGQGNMGSPGWAYVWEVFHQMLTRIQLASPRALLIAHMRDKFVNKDTGLVEDTDLDLSGKMRKILLREVPATGFMYRDRDSNLILSFKNVSGVNCGAWVKHLAGREITLGRINTETRETVYDWSQIYLANGEASTAPATPTTTAPKGTP